MSGISGISSVLSAAQTSATNPVGNTSNAVVSGADSDGDNDGSRQVRWARAIF